MVALFSQLDHLKYGGHTVSEAEIASLMDDIRSICSASLLEEKERGEKGIQEINRMTTDAIKELENKPDTEKTKKVYKLVIENYDRLEEEQKRRVYPIVRKLYEAISKGGTK